MSQRDHIEEFEFSIICVGDWFRVYKRKFSDKQELQAYAYVLGIIRRDEEGKFYESRK